MVPKMPVLERYIRGHCIDHSLDGSMIVPVAEPSLLNGGDCWDTLTGLHEKENALGNFKK